VATKNKKTKKRIMFSDLKLNRCVLEIRYPKGHLYWDVCGKSIMEINELSKENIDFLRLKKDECVLKYINNPKAEASFGQKHMTLSENELKNINTFKENGPMILDTVKKHLGIKRISRAGFRLIYVLPKDSYEDAEQFVDELSFCSVNAPIFKGFGSEVEAEKPVVNIRDGETNIRISVSAAKRTDSDEPNITFTEYAPKFAVLLDFDFSKENMDVGEFDLESFMHHSEKKVKENIAQILKK